MRFIKVHSRADKGIIYVRTDRIIKVTPSGWGGESVIHLDTGEAIEVTESMVQVVGFLETERYEKS